MLALIFATPKECAAALPGMPLPEQGSWRQATIAGRPVLVAVTGVGPLNAALCLGRILGATAPSGVLNLGLAGGFDTAALPLRSLAVANAEIWPEYGLRTAQGIDPRGIGFPLAQTPDGPIHDRIPLDPDGAARAMGLSLPRQWPRGSSLTVSAASGDPEFARQLQGRYHPATENMEGFALALGCLQASIPFLEVRAISNLVGSRDKAHWDLDGALAQLGAALSGLMQGPLPG